MDKHICPLSVIEGPYAKFGIYTYTVEVNKVDHEPDKMLHEVVNLVGKKQRLHYLLPDGFLTVGVGWESYMKMHKEWMV